MFINILENNTKILHSYNSFFRSVQQWNYSNLAPRRALMYIPGDDSRKINKIENLDCDCIVLDCEDGVAINQKQSARDTIHNLLNTGKPKSSRDYDLAVRINSVESNLMKDDLKPILNARNYPDTLLLPKVDKVEHINEFAVNLKSFMTNQTKPINLIMYIESAIGMINMVDICKAAFSIGEKVHFIPVSLVFGGDDFLASIGAIKSDDCSEIIYARQKFVLVAKAFGLQAIDIVYIQYKDLDGLKKQSELGAGMGFTGKQVIHPAQIPIVQTAFMPNPKQIQWAKELLKEFEEYQKQGKGAFTFKGSMIDMPTMKQAKNIVNLSILNK